MFVFFFKQKTAYEMRISDWSSDVCSSDLLRRPAVAGTVAAARGAGAGRGAVAGQRVRVRGVQRGHARAPDRLRGARPAGGDGEIGRASCRERGCQYV